MKFFIVTDVSRVIVLEIIFCCTLSEITIYGTAILGRKYGLAKNESYI